MLSPFSAFSPVVRMLLGAISTLRQLDGTPGQFPISATKLLVTLFQRSASLAMRQSKHLTGETGDHRVLPGGPTLIPLQPDLLALWYQPRLFSEVLIPKGGSRRNIEPSGPFSFLFRAAMLPHNLNTAEPRPLQ
ncbi:hypothetical protein NDU88_003317 [Pleurodeles waltl]|uniref:Uncharacterized protein n=1 Tax=Pleurodeles waltl TaxID=8319 RepID=A0AAV7T572_PLEWA|nr:hypothetical protein NDU88_003317 [Pleurodeles waltl]